MLLTQQHVMENISILIELISVLRLVLFCPHLVLRRNFACKSHLPWQSFLVPSNYASRPVYRLIKGLESILVYLLLSNHWNWVDLEYRPDHLLAASLFLQSGARTYLRNWSHASYSTDRVVLIECWNLWRRVGIVMHQVFDYSILVDICAILQTSLSSTVHTLIILKLSQQ